MSTPGDHVRFDDSLKTVLSADMATGFGAQSAWRQLVDLMGRGRMAADEPAIARMRMLRQAVPATVRAASGRALAFASPPAALVGLFAEDELAIAAPVLRMVALSDADWLALLPRLTPAGRSVLRHRRDLSPEVERGLESLGTTDFTLSGPEAPAIEAETAQPVLPEQAVEAIVPPPPPPADTPLSATPFVALGDVARGLPVVAEALRQATPVAPMAEPGRFEIADLVKRIDAFQRDRETVPATSAPIVDATPGEGGFRYETDAGGIIRWVEGVARSALVGVSFAYAAQQDEARLDGVVAGAFRRRSRFSDARLEVGGLSDAAGSWRLSGIPAFDHDSGRFTGFRGTARRPRRDEMAEPVRPPRSAASDSLRQLVHELRTPTNAISGFAELIETQLLGPVPPTYRERATAIRAQAADLLAAIDDLDTAARIEGHALELRPTVVPVLPLIERVIRDLAPLARLRGTMVVLDPAARACDVAGDDRAVERLVGRLLAALVSAGGAEERIGIGVTREETEIALVIDRPRSLATHATDVLLSIDAERENEMEGAPLLGTGFALRLAQNLAVELGGTLSFAADRLTLRLPACVDRTVEQAFDQLR